jgi:hypothetical protein
VTFTEHKRRLTVQHINPAIQIEWNTRKTKPSTQSITIYRDYPSIIARFWDEAAATGFQWLCIKTLLRLSLQLLSLGALGLIAGPVLVFQADGGALFLCLQDLIHFYPFLGHRDEGG